MFRRPKSNTCSATTVPFLLSVFVNGGNTKREIEYLTDNGTLTSDPEQGSQYEISSGQLQSDAGYISTSGLVYFQTFAPTPFLLPISRAFEILNGSLEWVADDFFGGKARFCRLGSVVIVSFSRESLPTGCVPIEIGAVDVDDILEPARSSSTTVLTTVVASEDSISSTKHSRSTSSTISVSTSIFGTTSASTSSSSGVVQPSPGTVFAQLAVAEFIACFQLDPNNLVIPGPGYQVSTLEQCVDYCASFSGPAISYKFVGVQFGKLSFATRASMLSSCRRTMLLWQ